MQVTFAPTHFQCLKNIIFVIGTDDNEYDDVTKFSDASKAGIKKALSTGSKAPLMCFFRGETKFREADIVTILGAMQVLVSQIFNSNFFTRGQSPKNQLFQFQF